MMKAMKNAGGKLFNSYKWVMSVQMNWSTLPKSICRKALMLCHLNLQDDNSDNQYFWHHIKTYVQKGIARRHNAVTKAIQKLVLNKYGRDHNISYRLLD